MSFVKDFNDGKYAENLIIKLLKKNKVKCKLNDSTTKKSLSEYDIEFEFNNKKYKAEVKYDLYEAKSGNLAIEYYNPLSEKESGVSSSKSHFWFTVLKNEEIYLTTRKKLLKYIQENNPIRVVEKAGDGNASIMLYRSEKILYDIYERFDDGVLECLNKFL